MTVGVLMGSSLWGTGIGLIFLYLLERDARRAVRGGPHWSFNRWLRPSVAAILVFVPSFVGSTAAIGSLFGFIVGRTAFLAYWTRSRAGRGTP